MMCTRVDVPLKSACYNNLMSSINARLKFAFILMLALAVGAAFFWAWFGWMVGDNRGADQSLEQTGPIGTLLLTYTSIDESTDTALIFPSVLHFTEGQPRYIKSDEDGTILTGLQYSVSKNKKWLTFIDSNPRVPTGGQASGVYRAQISGGGLVEMVEAAANSSTLVSTSAYPGFPSISDNGSVLFMSTTSPDMMELYPTAIAENWSIVLVDAEGNERFVTQGTHPQWLDEDNFLFFKNYGVFHYNLSSGTETGLLATFTPVTAAHRLVLDHKGERVLLLEPQAGAVRLFEIDRQAEAVTLREVEPIMDTVSSAVFSPNDQQVAVTRVTLDEARSHDLSLVVYDLAGVKLYEAPLPDTSLSLTSLEAWIR